MEKKRKDISSSPKSEIKKRAKKDPKKVEKVGKKEELVDIEDIDLVILRKRHSPSYHHFKNEEVTEIQKNLLEWFEENKRDLPWRNLSHMDENQRAYSIWVSSVLTILDLCLTFALPS